MRRLIPLVGVVTLVLGMAPSAGATSGTLYITSDTTLTEDRHGSIVIAADNVTLDCAGFSVIGPDTDGGPDSGIVVAQHSGVAIENCIVGGFAAAGFDLQGVTNSTLVANTASGNVGSGFSVTDATNDNLRSNRAMANLGPAFLLEGIGNLYTGNLAVGGPDTGFFVTGLSSGNEFRGNLAEGMGFYGFALAAGTTGTTLRMNKATGNGDEGFIVFSSTGNRLIGNTSTRNYPEGISLYFGADNNVISGNLLTHNGNSGILAVQSSHNVITNNAAFLNNTHLLDNGGGISLRDGSSYNLVTGNVACRNGNADGFDDHSGTNNTWEANQFCTSDI